MHIRPCAAFAFAWAAALAGCGGGTDGPGGDWSGTMRDSAGITVVSNPDVGSWTDEDRWTVTEELRIGATDGDPDYQFGQISGIAELSDGRLAVLDQQAQHLRVFSPEGVHLRTIGGAGSGPGEFGPGAGPVLIGPGDSILVPDFSNQRINRFTPDAEPAGSTAMDLTGGFPLAWMDTREGILINQVRPLALPGRTAQADSSDVILSLAADGTVLDTLLSFPSGGSFDFSDGAPQFEFFSPEPLWSTTSDGRLVYGYNDAYRILVYEGGELRRVFHKPFTQRPVGEEDEAVLREAIGQMFEDLGVPPEAMAFLRGRMEFGEFYPAYALVRGGPEGSVWVQHLRTLSEMSAEERESFNPLLDMGAPIWDVFDPEGRFLGELRLPDRYQPIRIEGDRIFGIWRDELDVQHVLILRVSWPAAELESS